MSQIENKDFLKELTSLINRHSRENESNTPDYILAIFLDECLKAFGSAIILRDSRMDMAHPAATQTLLAIQKDCEKDVLDRTVVSELANEALKEKK